ncbi:MAG: DUF4097 family beta strand repeat-containing protein [Turicibacter sp.]
MKKRNAFIKYLIVSSLIAAILFAGSLITFFVYDVGKLPQVVHQVITQIEPITFESSFSSNLAFQTESTTVNGYDYAHVSYYSVSEPKNLNISTNLVHSDLTVEGYDGDQVQVEIYSDKPDLYRLTHLNNEVRLEERSQFRTCFIFCGTQNKSKVSIKIPRTGGDLQLETVNGNISIINAGNHVMAQTVNGTIDVKQGESLAVELETLNGKIYMTDQKVNGATRLTTMNGDMFLQNVTSETLSTEAVNSDLTIQSFYGQNTEVNTVNGDVKLRDVYANIIEVDKVNGDFILINSDMAFQVEKLSIFGFKQNHEIQANILNLTTQR